MDPMVRLCYWKKNKNVAATWCKSSRGVLLRDRFAFYKEGSLWYISTRNIDELCWEVIYGVIDIRWDIPHCSLIKVLSADYRH